MTYDIITAELKKIADPLKAKTLARYFKTGIGEYGEGDVFIGVTVPDMRKIAKKHVHTPFSELHLLLTDKIHEYRYIALLILTYKPISKEVYDFYITHYKHINNWDLVDTSARDIVGRYLATVNNKKVLHVLARSKNVWERRIAIVATHYFIKEKEFTETFHIVGLLMRDTHPLIHKAMGWMLREIGIRDRTLLYTYLTEHKKELPRVTLRYALEHFSPDERQAVMR